jgi:hypothetical protein
MQIHQKLVQELSSNATDETIISEMTNKLFKAEQAHQRDDIATLSDLWWETLAEIQILADLRLRLKQAIAEDYVPKR